MAQEVVVEPVLSSEMILAGKKLIKHLDLTEVPVRAALWSYNSDAERWRLLIALPDVDAKGPLWAYQLLRESISRMPADEARIGLENIYAVDAEHPFIASLREVVNISGIDGTRFIKSVINGTYVEDIYIYRLT